MSRLDAIQVSLDHEPCCEHVGATYDNCSDCCNTGCAHRPYVEGQAEKDLRVLAEFAKEVREAYVVSKYAEEVDRRLSDALEKLEKS